METSLHGGDIQSFREAYGKEPLDFSVNVNPLGMSPLARQAVIDSLETADQYPDPHCRELRQAIARYESVTKGDGSVLSHNDRLGQDIAGCDKTEPSPFVTPENVLCGNGSSDLITRVALAVRPHKALVTAPTFSAYERALRSVDTEIALYELQEQNSFQVDEGLLKAFTPDIDIAFLCEPNNPTGCTTDPVLLERIVARCEECDTLLVVDECFNGFLPEPEKSSLKRYLSETRNLIIVKAFTKLYGMAGVRLGYALSGNAELFKRMEQVGQEWPVSSLAQAAGVAALNDHAYIERARSIIAEERTRLTEALSHLGCKVYPSQANYLLFSCSHLNLQTGLAKQGILIRDASNYHGLSQGFYRIAIRTQHENQHLIEALSAVLGKE